MIKKEEIFEKVKTFCMLVGVLVLSTVGSSFLVEFVHYGGFNYSLKQVLYGTIILLAVTTVYVVRGYVDAIMKREREEAQMKVAANAGAIVGACIVLYSWHKQLSALDNLLWTLYACIFLALLVVGIAGLGVIWLCPRIRLVSK